jgi:mRNA-degrading endonuclease RelE of RelBE toxin-antitoxin system
MPSEQSDSNIQIEFTDEFKRNLRKLAKSYHSIRTDISSLLAELERGELPGERIQHSRYRVYKVRVNNTDTRKGKQGGYRVIY